MQNNYHKVKIDNDGIITKVYIDDKQLKGITRVNFEHSVETIPEVTLEIMPTQSTTLADCVVRIGNIEQIADMLTKEQYLEIKEIWEEKIKE